MRITKYSIVAIVVVLFVTGCVAYSVHAVFLTAEDPEKRLLEEYEKGDRKRHEPPAIATYGKLPEFENEEQKRNWYAILDEIGKSVRTRGEMRPYFYPEGPVIGYGYNLEGYTEVTFLEGAVIEKPLMDEIYEIFDRRAREIGIQEVPLVFEFGEIPVED
jgi:streptogrisin B